MSTVKAVGKVNPYLKDVASLNWELKLDAKWIVWGKNTESFSKCSKRFLVAFRFFCLDFKSNSVCICSIDMKVKVQYFSLFFFFCLFWSWCCPIKLFAFNQTEFLLMGNVNKDSLSSFTWSVFPHTVLMPCLLKLTQNRKTRITQTWKQCLACWFGSSVVLKSHGALILSIFPSMEIVGVFAWSVVMSHRRIPDYFGHRRKIMARGSVWNVWTFERFKHAMNVPHYPKCRLPSAFIKQVDELWKNR